MSRRSRVAVAVAVVCCAGGGAASWAAFFSTTTSSDNSAATAGSFAHLQMQTGSYSGNATDNRAITGLSFQPDLVLVKGNNTQTGAVRTATMTGDASKPLAAATALSTGHIKALNATSFQVGTNARVNASGVAYNWVAFKAAAGVLKVGTYTGNGTSQSITGAGFSPEYAMVFPANTGRAHQRMAGSARSFRFESETGLTTRVTSLNGDGFSVGNSTEANANGVVYHYVLFNERGATVRAASYTGNGAARTIGDVGFQPAWVIVRADDTVTARNGRHRPASLTGTSSQHFTNAVNGTGAITALKPTGFDVGTTTDVNANGVTYRYVAFKAR